MSFGAERNTSGKTPDFGEHPDAAKKPQASKQKPNRRHGLEIGQAKPTDAVKLLSIPGETTSQDNRPPYDFQRDQLHQLSAALTVANRLGEEADVMLHSVDGETHTVTISNPSITRLPASESSTGEVKPTQPRGSIAEVVPLEEQEEAMRHFHGNWRRITGRPSRGNLTEGESRPGDPTLGVESRFLSIQSGRPYAWNVRGIPAKQEDVIPLLKAEKTAWKDAASSGGDHPSDEDKLVLHQTRYIELSDERGGGLWNVSIAIGGTSPEESYMNAILAEQVLNTVSQLHLFKTGDVKEVFPTRDDAHTASATDPFIAYTKLLATAMPLPLSSEITGIDRIVRPSFAVNIRGERDIPSNERLVAGKILDNWDNPAGDFFLRHNPKEGRHLLAAGASGKGKSAFIANKIEQQIRLEHAAGRSMGYVVLDLKTASHDYEELVDNLADLGIPVNFINLADRKSIGIGSNPFARRRGEDIVHRQASTEMIFTNALAAVAKDDPGAARAFTQYGGDLFHGSAIRGIASLHARLGWDVDRNRSSFKAGDPLEPDTPFFVLSLIDLMENFYDRYSRGDAAALQQWAPAFADIADRSYARDFRKGYHYDIDTLRGKNGSIVTVFRLGDIPNEMSQSQIGGTIIDDLVWAADGQKTGIVLEEAQTYAPKDSPGIKDFAKRVREVRNRNLDLTFAYQDPKEAPPEVIDNTMERIQFALGEANNIEAAKSFLGLRPDQADHLLNLGVGQAIYKPEGVPAVRVETLDPNKRIVTTKGEAGGAERIVLRRERQTLLTTEQKFDAEHILKNEEEGLILDYWAQMAAGVELLGWDTPAPDDDYAARKNIQFKGFEKLRTMAQSSGTEKAKLEYMVDEAVSKAVISRLELFKDEFPKEALIDKVKGSILAHLTDTQAPEPASYELPEFAAMTAKKERMYLFMSRNKNLISQRIAAAAEIDQLNGALAVIPASTPEHAALREQLVTTQQEAAALDTELVRYNAITYDPESRTGVTNPDDLTVIALEDMSQQHPLPDTLLLPSTPQGYLIDNPVSVAVADAIKSKDKSAWMAAHATILPLFRLTEAQRALIAEETGRVLDHKIAETEKTAAAEPAGRLDRVEILNNQMLQRLALLEKQVQDQKRHPEA